MFVTFEGIDGSGKTTQAALLAEWAAGEGHEVVAVREPGGTALGERIRELLLDGPAMTAWAEASLFAAARAELAERVIRPALLRGAWVVCDRYVDSSLAYQGAARGLGIAAVAELNATATGGLAPDTDRSSCCSIPASRWSAAQPAGPTASSARTPTSSAASTRGYRELVAAAPDRYVVLDGALPADELAAQRAERPEPADPRVSRFDRFPEQLEAKRLLDAALDDGPAHAYLFHGPHGVGKRKVARAFADELVGSTARSTTPTSTS